MITSHSGRVDRSSRLLMLLSLATLLWASWQRCAVTHHTRQGAKPHALPEPLQTWEGEGGSPVHDRSAT
jgi:transcriptional regulator of acetoin/glycerol metabolism